MSTNNKKKNDDKYLKILREFVCHEGNRYCFDCNQRGPTYVNITIGSFVCTNCGGALRKYNHRVKSISMSNFSSAEMDMLKKRGNDMCRKIYYGLSDRTFSSTKPDKLDDFLRQKYELKKWYLEPSRDIEEETERVNQEIFDKVEKVGIRPVRPSPNSAIGLIVQPPRGPPVSTTTSRPHQQSCQAVAAPVNGDAINSSHTTVTPTTEPSGGAVAKDLFGEIGKDPFATSGDPTLGSAVWPSASETVVPTVQSVSMPPPSGPVANSTSSRIPNADKYAALAELDGLFGGAAGSPPHPTGGMTSSVSAAAGWPTTAGVQQHAQLNHHWGSAANTAGWPPAAQLGAGGWANPFGGGQATEMNSLSTPGGQPNPFAAVKQQQPSQNNWSTPTQQQQPSQNNWSTPTQQQQPSQNNWSTPTQQQQPSQNNWSTPTQQQQPSQNNWSTPTQQQQPSQNNWSTPTQQQQPSQNNWSTPTQQQQPSQNNWSTPTQQQQPSQNNWSTPGAPPQLPSQNNWSTFSASGSLQTGQNGANPFMNLSSGPTHNQSSTNPFL